jgi:Asp-tRNA(Asn)/Glu-tRNA(Gln) amidotransferase A subunit family amidase
MSSLPLFLNSIASVSEMVNSGLITRQEIAQEFIENLHRTGNVNAWVQDRETICNKILEPDSISLAASQTRSKSLNGIVVGVKDNISTKDFPTLMGVDFWRGTPGAFDARIVSLMRNLGAIVAGKTRCSEFAVHRRTGTLNPRYPDFEPGTSSSGSAAAVANGEVSVALGTQTAGSIIKPASYCGVIGYKPSFGDIPRTGILKTTELFDTVGFLGRRVSDITHLYKLTRVVGNDHPIHTKNRQMFKNTRFTKIIILSGEHIDYPSSQMKIQLETFSKLLASKLQISIITSLDLDFETLRQDFYNMYYRDLAYFIRDHNIEKNISFELNQVLDFGLKIDFSAYMKSRESITNWQRFVSQISGNPLFLSFSTSTSAPMIGQNDQIDANLFLTSAGLPQISLPIFRSESGQLVGLNLSCKRFADESLLELASDIFPFDALTISSNSSIGDLNLF